MRCEEREDEGSDAIHGGLRVRQEDDNGFCEVELEFELMARIYTASGVYSTRVLNCCPTQRLHPAPPIKTSVGTGSCQFAVPLN